MRILVAMLTMAAGTALFGQDSSPGSDQKLTARQMFYGASEEASAPAKAPAAPHKTAKSTKPAVKAPSQASTATPQSAPATSSPAAANIVEASYTTKPLGLRYTLWKKTGADRVGVEPDAVFHSGDHIQLGVEVNGAGYLYILAQGTSHTWTALFPSAAIEDGDNQVQSGHLYTVPPKGVFTFTGDPGPERVFIIFSRQPEQDMERLIYSLQGGKPKEPAASTNERKDTNERKVLVASAGPVDDNLVQRIRQEYSRDLIVETDNVDEDQPGKKPVKAKYVVNPNGSADSRVVADISLTHQ